MTCTAAWVARTESSSIDVGLDPKEALVLAGDLIARLREGNVSPEGVSLDDGVLDVLHAAIEVIAGDGATHADGALEDASRLHHFISVADWPESIIEERTELLGACSLWAWRLARKAGKPGLADEWARRAAVDKSAAPEAIHGYTTDPKELHTRAERSRRSAELSLDDPETLLAICSALRRKIETSPAVVKDEAAFFFRHLAEPRRPIGLFDEREYFLGELALLAGSSSRILALRDDARRWFDLSEGNFRLTVNAVADWSRVAYQRLAVLLEERQFEAVLEQLPALAESFGRLEMPEDAIKCRFLEGSARVEMGDLSAACLIYEGISREASKVGNDRLLASAYVNLVHVHGMSGNTEVALRYSADAIPILERLENKVELGKMRVAVAFALRSRGQVSDAVEQYRQAQQQFASLSMVADVAALHLTIADLLLDLKQESAAMREVLFALPILEEYKLVPEGVAALSLLRESVRQQKVNHRALRDLHGFFEDSVS